MAGRIKTAGKLIQRMMFLCMGTSLLMGCGLFMENEPPAPAPTIVLPEPTKELQITPEPAIKKGYYFTYQGVEITVDMPAAEILKALGPHNTYFEAASCAIEGMIRTYGYGSFELDTYELNGTEYISSIYFKDDTVATEEGAYLFMTKEQLLSIYGNEYVEESGMLVYYKDEKKLKFLVTKGEVTAIQYISAVTDIVQ